jgi:hypothetical protein
VSSEEVLAALVDIAIKDETLYDPEDVHRPLDPLRREIQQVEQEHRTGRMDPEAALEMLAGTPRE